MREAKEANILPIKFRTKRKKRKLFKDLFKSITEVSLNKKIQ